MMEAVSLYPNQETFRKRVFGPVAGATAAATSPVRSGPCVSIYLSRQLPGESPERRRVQLIRMIKEAERLVAKDHGVHAARELIARFWRSKPMRMIGSSGMAVAYFHEKDFTGAMALPTAVESRTVVADSFHVKPVLQWLQSAPNYHLLSLTTRTLKLYEGTPWGLKVVKMVQIGEDHRNTRNGQKGQITESKEAIRQFFIRAEKELHPIVNGKRYPLVIAGVGWLHPIYRRVNRDRDLLSHAILGNVEKWSRDDLRKAALEAMGALMEQARKAVVRQFHELAYEGKATDDLAAIAQAAAEGRVKKVLVASDQLLFGRLDRGTGALSVHHAQQDSKDDDVLDDLAELVLARGGRVLCLPTSELPTRSPAAAVLSA